MTMFNFNKVSRKDAEKLLDAYLDYKEAESKFKDLKDRLTKDLPEGKMEFEGLVAITKSSCQRTTINGNKILEDHPEIDSKKYEKVSNVTSVTISNLRK